MEVLEAIQFMHDKSGVSWRRASSNIDRSPTFVSSIVNRGSCPRVDTFAIVCKAFGYKVQIVNELTGDVINID